jgi:aspartate aminotransferase
MLTTMAVEIVRVPIVNASLCKYEERADEVRKGILEHKPKVVMLVSPDNPTSKVLSDELVTAVMEACIEVGAFLVIDFAYKELTFHDRHPRYFGWPPNDHLILVRSNSKWCRGLGRRMGWLLAPEPVVSAIEAFQSAMVLAPDTLHQMAFARYVEHAIGDGSLKSYLRETRAMYASAAEETASVLERSGIRYLPPEGGLYATAWVGRDGAQFVEELLRKKSVLCVPGWGFGRTLANAIRISYGPLVRDPARLREGLQRLAELL